MVGAMSDSGFHVFLVDFTHFEFSVHLANSLSRLCRVTLMMPESAPDLLVNSLAPEVLSLQFRLPRMRYPTNIAMVRTIFAAIREAAPDVVHHIAWHAWMNLALPFFPAVPLVSSIHDASPHPGDRASALAFRACYSWQWRHSARIVVHSRYVRQQLVERHGVDPEMIDVVPLGAVAPLRLSSDQDDAGPPSVLFFGRIWEYKGLRYLLEAEPLIRRRIPNMRLVIAGQGESLARYGHDFLQRPGQVTVLNSFISHEMAARLFERAALVVLPYSEASQSGVIPMAYAYGKPVVASDVGGIGEYVRHGETGYLVPPRDPQRLAEAIVALLSDSKMRADMGGKALHMAQTELSWPRIAQQILRVYRKACAGAPAR